MFPLRSKDDEVERRDGVELPGLGIDGVEVGEGVGRAGHVPNLKQANVHQIYNR